MAAKLSDKQLDRFKLMMSQAEEDSAFVDELANTKREEFDGRSDNWKEGDKGTEADETINSYEAVRDALDALKDALSEVPDVGG